MRTLLDYLSDQELPHPIFSTAYGWGEVIELKKTSDYPIECKFPIHGVDRYTNTGSRVASDSYPELFLEEINLDQKIPETPLKVGDLVFWGYPITPYKIIRYDYQDKCVGLELIGSEFVTNCYNIDELTRVTDTEIDRRVKILKDSI